jgi:hypothetical protein
MQFWFAGRANVLAQLNDPSITAQRFADIQGPVFPKHLVGCWRKLKLLYENLH